MSFPNGRVSNVAALLPPEIHLPIPSVYGLNKFSSIVKVSEFKVISNLILKELSDSFGSSFNHPYRYSRKQVSWIDLAIIVLHIFIESQESGFYFIGHSVVSFDFSHFILFGWIKHSHSKSSYEYIKTFWVDFSLHYFHHVRWIKCIIFFSVRIIILFHIHLKFLQVYLICLMFWLSDDFY